MNKNYSSKNRNLASSQYNKISFCGVIENILTLGVRVPGSNPGGSKKSWQLETDLDASIIVTKFNRNLASTTKLAFMV